MTLGQYPEMNGSSATTGVRQMRASVMMLGSVQRIGRALAQRFENQLADRFQRVEHPVAADRHPLVIGGVTDPLAADFLDEALTGMCRIERLLLTRGIVDRPARVERRLQVLDRRGVGQVAF